MADHPRRLLIVPRWAGSPRHDWYPWITRQLTTSGDFADVRALEMPDPSAPTIPAWRGAVLDALGTDPARLRQTVLVGHSVGCQAALRALEVLGAAGLGVAGTLCVAGWWAVDEPWDSIRPWIDTPLDLRSVAAAAGRVAVVLSTNDPFTAGTAENRRQWESRLGASVVVVPNGAHFNGAVEPAVLGALLDHFGTPRSPAPAPLR